MDDDEFDGMNRKQHKAAMRSEMLHREQVRELELRKQAAETEASEINLLASKIGIIRVIGPEELRERLEKQLHAMIDKTEPDAPSALGGCVYSYDHAKGLRK